MAKLLVFQKGQFLINNTVAGSGCGCPPLLTQGLIQFIGLIGLIYYMNNWEMPTCTHLTVQNVRPQTRNIGKNYFGKTRS